MLLTNINVASNLAPHGHAVSTVGGADEGNNFVLGKLAGSLAVTSRAVNDVSITRKGERDGEADEACVCVSIDVRWGVGNDAIGIAWRQRTTLPGIQ